MAAVARVGVELDARGAVSGLRGLDAQARKTQGAFTQLRNAAVAVGAAAAAIKGAQFVFAKTAELETQTRSLKVLTGSLQDAQRVIKELQDFGAVTPFTSSELIETAKRLKAFGFETEKIVDVTKRLGDIAGATGADLGGIATAFGQIQAKGRLQGEELLQLQERGVDLQGTLRKEYGLTADEFQKALSKGQIGADAVNFALTKLTEKGGKYADGAIAQSDTLAGKLSTVQDNIDRIATKLGEVLAPALKNVLDLAIEALNAINQSIAARSLTTGEKQSFRDEAVREVRAAGGGFGVDNVVVRHLGKTYQGPPDQIIRQITNDLINKEVQRRAGTQALATSTANAAQQLTERPDLGGGTGGGTGGGKERVDMSQKMLEINQRLRAEQEAGNETLVATLELMQRRQEIAESNMLPVERQNALEQAGADFKEKVLGIEQKIAEEREKNAADAHKAFQDQIKQQEELAQAMREADPMFQMKQQMEELLNVQNQVAAGAQVIGNAFAGAFKSVITGSKSAEDALKDMLAATAEHFLDMAMEIIAQQLTMILYQSILNALGGPSFGGGAQKPLTSGLDFSSAFAEGGYVSGPTNALVGEGGEPEYIIPESKMRESMSRYSRGARGGSVIPESGSGGTSEEGGGTAVAAPIDVRYTVERINSVDYVTADQFQRGMQQAAAQGANAGEKRALFTLRQNTAQRKRIGL
jgi:tape measure domain-containing protein